MERELEHSSEATGANPGPGSALGAKPGALEPAPGSSLTLFPASCFLISCWGRADLCCALTASLGGCSQCTRGLVCKATWSIVIMAPRGTSGQHWAVMAGDDMEPPHSLMHQRLQKATCRGRSNCGAGLATSQMGHSCSPWLWGRWHGADSPCPMCQGGARSPGQHPGHWPLTWRSPWGKVGRKDTASGPAELLAVAHGSPQPPFPLPASTQVRH